MSERTPYSPKCLVDVIGDAAISGNHDELNREIGNNQDLRDVVSLHLVLARSAYEEVTIPGKPAAKIAALKQRSNLPPFIPDSVFEKAIKTAEEAGIPLENISLGFGDEDDLPRSGRNSRLDFMAALASILK